MAWGRRIFVAAVVAALLAVVIARFAIVREWHVPAGDGVQYFTLSQQLVKDRRLAYGGPPSPLAYTRLPGYPLFLAFVVDRKVREMERHLQRATKANVWLDLGTAILVLVLLRVSGVRPRTSVAALFLILTTPLLVLLSCYGLSESLATFLDTGELCLAICAMQQAEHPRRMLACAGAAGLFAGLAQLVRADAITVAPAVALAIVGLARAPWRRRLVAAALCGGVALVVFAPWPIRNLRAFGAMHWEGHQWPAQKGDAPPIGPIRWMRTWSSSAPGEGYVAYKMANNFNLDWHRPDELRPEMFDDAVERRQTIAAFERYNKERVSPTVNQMFEELARARRRRDPWRFWVTLPLGRVKALWSPVVEYELPMRVKWLHLPDKRRAFGWWEKALYLCALVGAAASWRGGRRRLVALCLLVVATRTIVFAFAVPHGVTERYLVEAYPLVIALAACGLGAIAEGSGRLGQRAKQRVLRALHSQPDQGEGRALVEEHHHDGLLAEGSGAG